MLATEKKPGGLLLEATSRHLSVGIQHWIALMLQHLVSCIPISIASIAQGCLSLLYVRIYIYVYMIPSSKVFARFLQRFWLPACHLLGTCYPLDDLRSTHTPSKYLPATYSHIYMCYVATSYIYIYLFTCYIIDTYINICIYIYIFSYSYLNIHICIYTNIHIFTYIYICTPIYIYICAHTYIYIYI